MVLICYVTVKMPQDPNSHKIAQWLNQTGTGGVFQGKMPLSDQPPLGDWRIQVNFEVRVLYDSQLCDEHIVIIIIYKSI